MHIEGHALRLARAALLAGRGLASVASLSDPAAGRLVRKANVALASAVEVLARRQREAHLERRRAYDRIYSATVRKVTRHDAAVRQSVRRMTLAAEPVLDLWAAKRAAKTGRAA